MKQRDIRIARLNMVAREHGTALVAISTLDHQLRLDPSFMDAHDLLPQDVRHFRRNLEATYLVRLFAEFESCLRDLWRSLGRHSHPSTTDLINALASRLKIRGQVLVDAHKVREYRNMIVHEDAKRLPTIPVSVAIDLLRRFVKYLPADWR